MNDGSFARFEALGERHTSEPRDYYEIVGPYRYTNRGLFYAVRRVMNGKPCADAVRAKSLWSAARCAKALRTRDAREHPERASWSIVEAGGA